MSISMYDLMLWIVNKVISDSSPQSIHKFTIWMSLVISRKETAGNKNRCLRISAQHFVPISLPSSFSLMFRQLKVELPSLAVGWCCWHVHDCVFALQWTGNMSRMFAVDTLQPAMIRHCIVEGLIFLKWQRLNMNTLSEYKQIQMAIFAVIYFFRLTQFATNVTLLLRVISCLHRASRTC